MAAAIIPITGEENETQGDCHLCSDKPGNLLVSQDQLTAGLLSHRIFLHVSISCTISQVSLVNGH